MKIGIVYKEGNKKAESTAKAVYEFIKKKVHLVLAEKNLEGSEIILIFGGDGTLIHKACEYAALNVPFVGINTGNLGFLTAAEVQDWQKAVDKLIKGQIVVSERMTLEASLEKSEIRNPKSENSYRALNEVVIKGLYRIIELEISVNGEKFLKIVGDGVIVATQTGSTAYSLSAGGPIVDPDLDSMLITPINPIGLPIPSVVLSPKDVIKVKTESGEDISLVIDGQEHTKLKEGQTVKITRGKYNVKFGYFDKHQFLKSLNAKFGLSARLLG